MERMKHEPAIQIDNVTKQFKDKKAVDRLSLTIEKGSVTALLGPNGAGKTTTVSMILGLMKPTSGTVKLLGGDPHDRAVRSRIGAMLQDTSVIDDLKVGETIDLFRSYYSRPLPLERLLAISGLGRGAGQAGGVAVGRTAAQARLRAGCGRRPRGALPRRADGRHGRHGARAVLGYGPGDGRQGQNRPDDDALPGGGGSDRRPGGGHQPRQAYRRRHAEQHQSLRDGPLDIVHGRGSADARYAARRSRSGGYRLEGQPGEAVQHGHGPADRRPAGEENADAGHRDPKRRAGRSVSESAEESPVTRRGDSLQPS
ncbi:hypothetical protein BN871_BX_00160 [Paenibacillus sp. P22]|nr:hypothetical protein BN871_BX_00160 [Paenibacillus sp. P22]